MCVGSNNSRCRSKNRLSESCVTTKRCVGLGLLVLLFSIAITGCGIHRITAITRVDDSGDDIRTRYKYKLCEWNVDAPDEADNYVGMKVLSITNEDFKKMMPEVFSDSGIPFALREKNTKTINSGDGISAVLGILTLGILPIFRDSKYELPFEMTLADFKIQSEYHVEKRHDAVGTILSPFGLVLGAMFYDCPPQWEGKGHCCYDLWYTAGPNGYDGGREDEVIRKAIVYGVAAKLKELEEAGKIDAMKLTHQPIVGERESVEVALKPNESKQESQPSQEPNHAKRVPAVAIPSYKIISCKRDTGDGFSYRFVLELKGEDQSSLNTFRAVQREFREAVKADYAESFPNVRVGSLFVDFPEYELDNGKIMGRAVVLTISVTSLTYDPNTRAGKLAVKVNANQYEEARKWVRKNIETLARDKNIALTTGEIPPSAKFYLGREELRDGNILEIEFKTE